MLLSFNLVTDQKQKKLKVNVFLCIASSTYKHLILTATMFGYV